MPKIGKRKGGVKSTTSQIKVLPTAITPPPISTAFIRKELLSKPIKHIDISKFDARPIIEAYSDMSFSAKDLADATRIYSDMLNDSDCTIFLALAGSTSAAGCKKIYSDLVKHNMVDVVCATGASLIDMAFFEDLGFNHYQLNKNVKDEDLGSMYIDRIYSVLIDEEQLQEVDLKIYEIAKEYRNKRNVVSSRQFLKEVGRWLRENHSPMVDNSIILEAHFNDVPLFVPAFSDCAAGMGLVKLRAEALAEDDFDVSIDSVQDFYELTQIKANSKKSGIIIIGGGVPKNFVMDTVISAEVLGLDTTPFDYAIQISVADPREGALSGSELKELNSWRKASLNNQNQATVFSEVTSTLPLMASAVYHENDWESNRLKKRLTKLFQKADKDI